METTTIVLLIIVFTLVYFIYSIFYAVYSVGKAITTSDNWKSVPVSNTTDQGLPIAPNIPPPEPTPSQPMETIQTETVPKEELVKQGFFNHRV